MDADARRRAEEIAREFGDYRDDPTGLETAIVSLVADALAQAEREREQGCHSYRGTAISCDEYEQMQQSKLAAARAEVERLKAQHRKEISEVVSQAQDVSEQAEADLARVRAALNDGFCRKCGETYAPNSGSDPEHRWPY